MILACFGDMMRVPGGDGSFLDAKAPGADIRMVYSPLDALRIARQNPDRQVVFYAIGFETTAPSTALTVLRAKAEGITNFSVFCNHVTIIPAIKAILDSPDLRLDAFIGPGHVSTVIGCRPYEFIARDVRQTAGVRGLRAAGPAAVDPHDHAAARRGPVPRWRTSTPGWSRGTATRSRCGRSATCSRCDRTSSGAGWASSRSRPCSCPRAYADFDAELRFDVPGVRVADPKACQCGEVLKGVLKPWECKVFGTACTPETPIGTCMVSSEGACAAYYNFGRYAKQRIHLEVDLSEASRMGKTSTEVEVGERIEAMRRRRPRFLDERITTAHGAGGKASRALVEGVSRCAALRSNPELERLGDAALLDRRRRPAGADHRRFRGAPLRFPGGSIGELAVNGTVNDLAVSGARPLSCPPRLSSRRACRRRAAADVAAMAAAARAAGVPVVTGDTKVVERGQVRLAVRHHHRGRRRPSTLALAPPRSAPATRCWSPAPSATTASRSCSPAGTWTSRPTYAATRAAVALASRAARRLRRGLHCMRDATRGGVATVLNEIALAAEVGVVIAEDRLPLRREVIGAGEILGIDPLYVANEGKLVAFVAAEQADAALAACAPCRPGRTRRSSARSGEEPPGRVLSRRRSAATG